MYELIALSLLMRSPFHGYLIVKITNDMIGPWAKISSGTLYPLLTRMEKAGLIALAAPEQSAQAGERTSRIFVITEEGRKRFHQLMMDMSSNLGDYQRIFRYKLVYFDLLQPQERMLLYNHYVNYCQTSILHTQTEMANLPLEITDPSQRQFLVNALTSMQHIEQQMQAELEWARELRERERENNPPEEAFPGKASPAAGRA